MTTTKEVIYLIERFGIEKICKILKITENQIINKIESKTWMISEITKIDKIIYEVSPIICNKK